MYNKSLINNISKQSVVVTIYSFCIFLLAMPYFMWQTGEYFKLFIMVIVGIISITYLKRFRIVDIIVFILFVFIFLYNSGYLNIIGIFSSRIMLLSFFVIREDIMLLAYNRFKKIMTISFALSLITYILIVVFSRPLNYNVIAPLNELKNIYYFQYPLLLSKGHLGISTLNIRFQGMFDEPGVVGTFAAIFLLIDKFSLKSKQNVVLFISGILSFSLFFIIIGLTYFLYAGSIKARFSFFIIILAVFLLLKDNVLINYFVFDRLKIENGEWSGNDRTTATFDNLYTNFIKSDDLLWGKGFNYLLKKDEQGIASYKQLIITNGLVFIIVLVFSFILLAFSIIKKPKARAVYLFLFFSLIFQRPFIYNPEYLFILVSCIFAIKQSNFSDEVHFRNIQENGILHSIKLDKEKSQ